LETVIFKPVYDRFKNSNPKSQTPNKFQTPITNDRNDFVWNFGHSCLPAGRGAYLEFGACDLVLNKISYLFPYGKLEKVRVYK